MILGLLGLLLTCCYAQPGLSGLLELLGFFRVITDLLFCTTREHSASKCVITVVRVVRIIKVRVNRVVMVTRL